MKKKNKSITNPSLLKEYYPKCSICGKHKSDVRYRKLYDYINCEYDNVLCCSDCEGKIIEDSIL